MKKRANICTRCIKECQLKRESCDTLVGNAPNAKRRQTKHRVVEHGIYLQGERYRCPGGHSHPDPTGAEMMAAAGSPELI